MTDRRAMGPWILDQLAARGIEDAFGIPGVHTIDLYRGLAEHPIRHVTPRHEQGAGFMADAYARVRGYPAVCFVITGPGLTNIATAMGQAYSESIPLLVISSVSDRRHLGRGLGQLHELPDQQGLVAGVSAFSHTLQSLADLPALLDRAFAVFHSGRPRPVHIEIPLDLWRQVPDELPSPSPPELCAARPRDASLYAAARRLETAEHPVILAGGGARFGAARLRTLAEHLDAPVVMTVNARGLLPPGHPLAIAASPSLEAVRALLGEADAVLAIGTEMGPTDYDLYERGMPEIPGGLIRLDVDPLQMAQPYPAEIALIGATEPTLAALQSWLSQGGAERGGALRAERVRSAARDGLPRVMQRAVDLLDRVRDAVPEAILVGDSTHPIYAGNLYFEAPRPGSWFNSATGYGTLGFALPAALGAALAAPQCPVVCIVGDGGLHFTLGELGSIRDQERPVIVLLWDNAGFGEIERAMQADGVQPVGVELFSPAFEELARAFGFGYEAPGDVDALCAGVMRAVDSRQPRVIHVSEHAMVGGFD